MVSFPFRTNKLNLLLVHNPAADPEEVHGARANPLPTPCFKESFENVIILVSVFYFHEMIEKIEIKSAKRPPPYRHTHLYNKNPFYEILDPHM